MPVRAFLLSSYGARPHDYLFLPTLFLLRFHLRSSCLGGLIPFDQHAYGSRAPHWRIATALLLSRPASRLAEHNWFMSSATPPPDPGQIPGIFVWLASINEVAQANYCTKIPLRCVRCALTPLFSSQGAATTWLFYDLLLSFDDEVRCIPSRCDSDVQP